VETSLNTHLAAIAVGMLVVGFAVFCLIDLAPAEKVRYLPKWASLQRRGRLARHPCG
jgi:hypothetical protein